MTFPGGDQKIEIGVFVKGVAALVADLNKTERAVLKTSTAITKAAKQTQSINTGLQQSTVAALRFGSALSGLKFGAAFLGIQSAAALTGDLLADTVNAFISYEDALVRVAKTTGLTKEETAGLGKELVGISKRLPITAVSLANFAAIAGQLGTKNVDDLKAFAEMMGRVERSIDGGGITADEFALRLAQIGTATKTPIQDLDELASLIVALSNELPANEAAIIQWTQTISGTLSALGFTAEGIVAIGAAFASTGVPAEAGGTAVRTAVLKMVSAVGEGTKEAREHLRLFAFVAGQSSEEFKAAWEKDPEAAFKAFVDGIATIQESQLEPLFDALGLGTVRGIEAFLKMSEAGDNYTTALKTMQKEQGTTNALMNESNAAFDTTSAKLQVQKNAVTANAIEIGRNLAPAMLELFRVLAVVTGGLQEFTAQLKFDGGFKAFLKNIALVTTMMVTGPASWTIATLAFFDVWNRGWNALPDPVQSAMGKVTSIVGDAIGRIGGYLDTLWDRQIPNPKNLSGGLLDVNIVPYLFRGDDTDFLNRPDLIPTSKPNAGKTGGGRTVPGLGDPAEKGKEAAKTALEGFLEALLELNIKRRLEEKFGELGAAAIAALATAIQEGASSSDGAQVVGAITDLIEDAKEAGIPNAQALGDDLIAAISSAMAQKTPEAFDAATAAVQRFTDTLAASRKTTEDALNAIADSASAAALVTGDAGDAIGAALVNAITDGSKEAVRSFNDEMDHFVQEANRAGITVGEDLTSALATAIRDGTPAAVTAALEMIAKIDAAMQASAKAVESVNFLGGALMESLREQAQEEADLARSALEDQAKAARAFADGRVETLRDQEQATAESFQNQAESARDGFDAQADAAREFGETATEASRDRHKELIRLIDDQTFFALKALDDEKERIKKQQKEISDARTDAYDLQIEQIESALDARLAAIDAELRALEDLDDEDERIRLERDLSLAYDNDKRFDAEQALRRFDRNERRQALQREASDLRGAAGNAIDALKNQLDEIEELQDEALQIRLDQIENEKDALSRAKTEEKRILDDWLDAAIDTIDAEEERRLKSIETQEKAQLASLEARAQASANSFQQQIQAAEAARDRELVIIEGQQEAVEEAYRQRTSAFAIEGEARKLIEDKNQAAIIALIGKYFPQWETAGFSLGDQLVNGMKRAGIQTYLESLLSQINATKIAATTVPNPFLTGWGPTPTQPGLPPGSLSNRIVIPGLDAGGIVTGPTMAMLSMNSVPEIVMPLPQYLSQMSNGVSLSLDLRGSSFMGSPQQNGSEIASQVESMMVSILTRGAQLDGVSR